MKLRICVHVTQEMTRQVISALRERQIRYIIAPYEADAQMVHLVNIGLADFAITEDADLILFGCRRILFKFDRTKKHGVLYKKERLPAKFKDLTYLRRLCIISGCDYLPNLPGIGIKKAEKFMQYVGKENKCEDELRKYLKRIPFILSMPKVKVSEEYIRRFFEAERTFTFQLTYCPRKGKQVPLNPYPAGRSHADYPYAGEQLEPSLAKALAFGNLNLDTLEYHREEDQFIRDDKWLFEARESIVLNKTKLELTVTNHYSSQSSAESNCTTPVSSRRPLLRSLSARLSSPTSPVSSSSASSLSSSASFKRQSASLLPANIKRICNINPYDRKNYSLVSPQSTPVVRSKYFNVPKKSPDQNSSSFDSGFGDC